MNAAIVVEPSWALRIDTCTGHAEMDVMRYRCPLRPVSPPGDGRVRLLMTLGRADSASVKMSVHIFVSMSAREYADALSINNAPCVEW